MRRGAALLVLRIRRAVARFDARVGDRGSSTVETAVLFPLIVVLLFGGPQLGMWYFGREVAQSAAVAGVRAASADGAPSGAGKAAAISYLSTVGGKAVSSYSVEEDDSATTVTIHIHVTVPNVVPLPGMSPSADITVTRQKERFTTPDSP